MQSIALKWEDGYLLKGNFYGFRKISGCFRQSSKKRFPCTAYHIGGYQEAAVCIQSDDVGWIVYNGERGNRYDKIECDTILKACLEFIRKLTHNIQEYFHGGRIDIYYNRRYIIRG